MKVGWKLRDRQEGRVKKKTELRKERRVTDERMCPSSSVCTC